MHCTADANSYHKIHFPYNHKSSPTPYANKDFWVSPYLPNFLSLCARPCDRQHRGVTGALKELLCIV